MFTPWSNHSDQQPPPSFPDPCDRRAPDSRSGLIAGSVASSIQLNGAIADRTDKPAKTVARTIAIIGEAVPDLAAARDLLDRFHRIIQHRKDDRLEVWTEDAKHGLMKSFATGIVQDHAASKAALTEPWSNGQTEGQNTKLKLVKRQMYSRAGIDLLRARLLSAT